MRHTPKTGGVLTRPVVRIEPVNDPAKDFEVVNEKLDRILQYVQELHESKPNRKRGLIFGEWQLMQKLLPALGSDFGESVFTVHDLLAVPKFNVMLQMSAKCTGNLFSRAEFWQIDGYRLLRSGSLDNHVTLWTVVQVIS